MKKKRLALLLCAFTIAGLFTGCSGKGSEPVTLTMWHVYGGQTDSPLNDLIDEFNDTVGKKENIRIQVTAVSNTNTIHEEILDALSGKYGSLEMPDMFISYPKTVLALPDEEILVDYRDYFSEKELSGLIPEFIEEGTVNDRLCVFPVAKSTEVLFVNKTLFDRFAAATGASIEMLDTWEGLFQLTQMYYQWTDSQTPDVAGDGRSFFTHDYLFNYLQVGTESKGESFFIGDELAFGSVFDQVWDSFAQTAVKGGIWLGEGYATEPLRTGDAIVSVASTASVLYYKDEVTYDDNTSEPVEIIARPCPVFADGQKLVMQRGAGFCTVKSTPEKEKAAVTFLKWLSEPECNVRFVTQVGYMPVSQEAFDKYLPEAISTLSSSKYKSLYQAMMTMQSEYSFYTAPQTDSYLELEQNTEKYMRSELENAYSQYHTIGGGDEDAARLSQEALEAYKADIR